ncbi:Transcription initiation factor TFIID subunit 12 [Coemansia aciculifera]|uniref:TBP-associated factor 12 n=1 Tax=Coemansia pectinata TaxID=1052879 RepID=A0A9W8GQY4_9FUNG|nr:Transcription initiation factor TFIID subunit 12 [Coemansia pectinata]KAJ2879163.1 Transcription initiation factor TFIID subunit 12 [Coemansia aciculifera]
MASNSGTNTPPGLVLPPMSNADDNSAAGGGDKNKGKAREPPLSAASSTGTSSGLSKGKGKDTPITRDNTIILSPAMVQQMHTIIGNHPTLKRDADNNLPFTNHMLDLIPVPAEFSTPYIENTSQATKYINAECSKIRAHLTVVQQIKDSIADPDARGRLDREVDAMENHIRQVQEFMRLSFHSALSGNPATAVSSFGPKEPAPASSVASSSAPPYRKPPTLGDVSRISPMASPGIVPGSTPLTPNVMGVKPRQPPPLSGHAMPQTNPHHTHVALSSALSHVAMQSTRQNGPVDLDVGSSRILSKRKIQELVSEIDPTERLEPQVEDILCDIADEFIESVTTFACKLAKHRKSDALEAKDLQLHLERNWNIRIPGFASEEIRSVRKTTVPQTHQEKISAIVNNKNMRKFD